MTSLHVAAVALVWLMWPAVARAHPAIDEAVSLYERAEFTRAQAALDEAARSGQLDRDDVLLLLSTQALVRYALRNTDAMERALTRLASIDPEHTWGPATPPDVLAAFQRAVDASGGAVAVTVSARARGSDVEIAIAVAHDDAGLVEATELGVRVAGVWRVADGTTLTVPRDGDVVAYYAVARGPGGAELARAGSAEAPLTTELPRLAPEPPPRSEPNPHVEPLSVAPPETPRPSSGSSPWPWIGIGAGLAVAAGVVIAIVLASGGDSRLVGPGLDWMGDG